MSDDGIIKDSQPVDEPAGTLLDCLVELTKFYDRRTNASALVSGLPLKDNELTLELFQRAANRAHLKSQFVKQPFHYIRSALLPCILFLKDNQFCLLFNLQEDGFAEVFINQKKQLIRTTDLEKQYADGILLAKPENVYTEEPSEKTLTNIWRLSWLRSTVRQFYPLYGEIFIASFFINLLALASPLFVMNVYDRVVPNAAIATLWMLAIGVFIAFLFDFLLRLVRTHFVDNAARNIDAQLSTKIFERLMGIQMIARPDSVGQLNNTVQAFEAFRDFMTSLSVTVLVDFPFTIIFIVVIAIIGGKLFLVPLILMPLVFIISTIIQTPLIKLVRQSYALASIKQQALIETLVGITTIKAQNAESVFQRKWERLACYAASIGAKLRFLNALAMNFSTFSQYLGSAIIVIAGVYMIAANHLSMGALIACTILTGRALAPLAQIANLFMRYYQSLISVKGIDKIMNLPIERPIDKKFMQPDTIINKIEFKNVDFAYPKNLYKSLADVSFIINPGEHVAIVGRVGAGKTTLLKLAVGLYTATKGKILISDVDNQQLDPMVIRHHIGYVPQDIILFSGTVRDNIILGDPNASDTAILNTVKIAGLSSILNEQPDGIDMKVGERGDRLSGGQRQGVALAQALLHDPSILILDEPTTSMDEANESAFMQTMKKVTANKTLLLATHKSSMLALVERIIVLDKGKIVADGKKDTVLAALREKSIQAQAGHEREDK